MQIRQMIRSRLFRRILLLVGVLLIIGAIAGSVGWFYFFMPFRKLYDNQWLKYHSHHAIWTELQKSLKRNGGSHDEFMRLGDYGDKEWVHWLIENIKPGQHIADCSAGHKHGALVMMTNQDPGYQAEDWIAWWENNQDKTQVEWIREGFESHGINLQTPLTQENIISLLRVLGGKDNRGHPYNAYRWLRDSYVDLSKFGYTDLPKDNPEAVFEGIKRYNYYRGYFPWNGPGYLAITGPGGDDESCLYISRPWNVILINALLGLSTLVGLYCIYLSRKLRPLAQAQIDK